MLPLEEKINSLPDSPGVYIMYDDEGTIIYIGKAKVLKNRVRSYFRNSAKPIKVEKMMEKVRDFRYIITESELDAFALEATLVKKHQPQYNILLKDDKNRPYIRIDIRKPYPALEITRGVKNDGASYFGPYMFGINVREVVEMIVNAFNLRTCSNTQFNAAKRACINFHIGRCSGACSGELTVEQYRKQIEDAVEFLSGKSDVIRAELERKMNTASEREEFETAIRYRNQLTVLDKMHAKLTTHLPYDTNLDIFAYATNGDYSSISVTTVRGGRMTGLESHPVSDNGAGESESLAGFISQYYLKNPPPSEIILSGGLSDAKLISDYLSRLSGKRVKIIVPKNKGIKKDMLINAKKNSEDYLLKSVGSIKLKEDMTLGAIAQLKKFLNLKRVPRRIECYDISNISGTDSVASMTVAINGEKAPKEYRKFRIKTVEGADDYASMREVIFRRLTNLKEAEHGFEDAPDLIVIDGGQGQLSSALDIMQSLSFNFDMIGLAEKEELIYLPNNPIPVRLPISSFALKCLIRVRDEAHRFALSYHRSLREKRNIPSQKKTKK